MTPLRYLCECGAPIVFANVLYLSPIRYPHGAEPWFEIDYQCDCVSDAVIERKFILDNDALKLLLNRFRPRLPYHSADAGPALQPEPRLQAQVDVFAWECAHLDDVEEFLLMCGRPRRR